MNISEAAEKFGITPDTLRYYERIGIIPKVTRTTGGKRDFQEEDLRWVQLAVCIRSAGLSIEILIEYVRLFELGDSTIEPRMELLKEQIALLEQQKRKIDAAIGRLSEKLVHYEEAMKTGKLVWDKEETKKQKEGKK